MRFTESITVLAEPPVINVYSSRREVTLTGDVVRSLPTTRSYNALLVLVPGVVTNGNDTVMAPATTSFPIHGGRQQEGRLLLDGLTVGSPPIRQLGHHLRRKRGTGAGSDVHRVGWIG